MESRLDRGSNFFITLPWGTKHLPPGTGHHDASRIPHAPDASPYLEEALQWLPDHESEVLRPEIPAPPQSTTRAGAFSLPTTMPTCVAT